MISAQILDVLSIAEEFSNFTRDELQALVEVSSTRIILDGQSLWGLGESRHACFVLLSGSIERRYPGTSCVIVETFDVPGDVLSWSALVGSAGYYSAAYAKERAEVLVLTRETFQDLFAADAPVAYALIDLISTYLANDMRAANTRLKDVFGRPAETLRMLRRRIREDAKL